VQFDHVHAIPVPAAWRVAGKWTNGPVCFLSPALFDELLLVQYLVSRSHKAGGLNSRDVTRWESSLEGSAGRATSNAVNVHSSNPPDALEQLLHHLAGGEASLGFYRRTSLKYPSSVIDATGPCKTSGKLPHQLDDGELLEGVRGMLEVHIDRVEVARPAEPSKELSQRVTSLECQAAGLVRTADQILYQQEFVKQRR